MDSSQDNSIPTDKAKWCKCHHCEHIFIERKALYMIHICGKFYPICPKCGLSKFGSKPKTTQNNYGQHNGSNATTNL